MPNEPQADDTLSWLDLLLRENRIALKRGPLLSSTPARVPLRRDRFDGMLLGLAIGDALGNTSEAANPELRARRLGEVRDYLPNRHAGERRVGLPSDDTQLAFWTLERLIEDGGYIPERVARAFTGQQIFGIGASIGEFIRRSTIDDLPWHRAGVASAGNGALMRIAPMVVPHLREPSPGLWADTALSAMTTHNDTAAITSALAFVGMLWDLLGMKECGQGRQAPATHEGACPPRGGSPPEPESRWWVDRYVELAGELETDTTYTPRGGAFVGWRGSLSAFVAEHVPDALASGLTAREACDAWYSGAFLLETVPSVLFILARHGHDPEEAIVRAVNDTRDNDTVAAIVGAAVGALHGADRLPERWRTGLLGRTTTADDGRAFELMDRAWERFVAG